MDCIFCKIINGEIPSYKVYEDENVIAILDISQATVGHTIIMPKKHFKNIYKLSAEESANIFKVVPEISRAIQKAFKPIGLNIIINTDKPLQSVMHLHIHLLPRYDNDDLKIEFVNNMHKINKETFENIKNKIIKELK